MTHEIDLLPQDFILQMRRPFDLRPDNPAFQAGDVVQYREYDEYIDQYTGRVLQKRITYVHRGCPQRGLMSGFCIIAHETIPVQ